jgi:hypothetical protein
MNRKRRRENEREKPVRKQAGKTRQEINGRSQAKD